MPRRTPVIAIPMRPSFLCYHGIRLTRGGRRRRESNAPSIAELIFPWVMFPDAECLQRNQQPAQACSQVVGQ